MDDIAEISASGAFARGFLVLFTVPGVTIFCTSIGFGALANSVGFSAFEAALSAVVVFALPAQVMFADQWAREASWLAISIAVALTGVRLMPMTVSVAPLLRKSQDTRRLGLIGLLAVHFVSITSWIEAHRQLPKLPAPRRMPCYLGVGCGIMLAGIIGSLAGYHVAGTVDPLIAAILLFMTPLYFLLSLFESMQTRADFAAIALGLGIAPVMGVYAPSLDLVATGLIGGTLAYALRAFSKRHASGDKRRKR